VVVDEAHRLKNKDSAVAAELRSLSTEHLLLLTGTPLQNNTTELWAHASAHHGARPSFPTGTPLQNNTTELWALLSLLDTALFPDLDAFLARFGTLTETAQVEELKEMIRPYLLRRQKSDVLRGDDSLAPLEETCMCSPRRPPFPHR
jgi:chromodomain-helicase-DNA-binding protein 7